jgi:hypothetical protein
MSENGLYGSTVRGGSGKSSRTTIGSKAQACGCSNNSIRLSAPAYAPLDEASDRQAVAALAELLYPLVRQLVTDRKGVDFAPMSRSPRTFPWRR